MVQQLKWSGWNEVLKIAWPLIVASSFWNIQLTIDRVFLGNYSTEALGAAMAVMAVFWTPMALLQQTAAYSITFVAQYFGANQHEKIGPSIWQSIYVSLIGGAVFLLLIPAAPTIFFAMGHSAEILDLEIVYFQALAHSALPTALVAALSGFYTGLGQSKMVMVINGVGLLVNVVLDYLLIFGNLGFPAMGIAGAGYATAGANWAAAIFAAVMIYSKSNEKLYRIRSGWRWSTDLMKRFLKYGLPSGLQWALEGLAFTFFLILIGRMPNGNAALAASSIAVTVMMLAILPALGIGQAVSVLVGQHLGENNADLAERSTWSGVQIAFAYISMTALTFVLFPNFYLSWFHNPSEIWNEVAIIVPYLLMFVAAFTCFDSINMVMSFTLKGAGDTRFVTLVALAVPWPLMVLPTYIVQNRSDAIYWAWAAASVFIMTQAVVFWFRFTQGKWKRMRVIEQADSLN